LVSGVGKKLLHERKKSVHRRHDQHPAIAILNVGWVNHRMHQQTRGVDQNMPLLATDFLPRIIPFGIDAGPPFSALFTLWLSMTQAVGLASRPSCSRPF
jgi:hypothetical protein